MSLSIKTSNPNNIYSIDCGTSVPKLSGSVNITSFPNLTSFICVDNDITSFTAPEYMPSLLVLLLSSNKLTGTFSLTGFPNIQNVNLNKNLFDVVILSVPDINTFTYTSPTSSAIVSNNTASTTGRIYKTLTSTTPLSSYQRLALPTTLGGLGWTVTIVFQQ